MKKYLIILLTIMVPTLIINQVSQISITEKISSLNFSRANTYQLNIGDSKVYDSSFEIMFQNMIKNNDLLYHNPSDTNNNPNMKNELLKVANRNNKNNYLIIEENYQGRIIDLIIETQYWYLDGFVPVTSDSSNLNYYHFSKAKVLSLPWVKNSYDLNYDGDYYSLAGTKNDVLISHNEINQAFDNLYNVTFHQDFSSLKLSLVTTVFETAEALRFFTVRNSVNKVLSTDSKFSWRNVYLDSTLRNWGNFSRQYYSDDINNAKNNISVLNLPRKTI